MPKSYINLFNTEFHLGSRLPVLGSATVLKISLAALPFLIAIRKFGKDELLIQDPSFFCPLADGKDDFASNFVLLR